MKEQEVELEQLRQLVVAMVGREQVGCASGSGGWTVYSKVGEDDERDARKSSPQPGSRLRGGKVTGRRERDEGVRREGGGRGHLEMPQTGQEATTTDGPVTKCPENITEAGYKCVYLKARSMVNKKSELSILVEDTDPYIIGITES